MQAAGSSYEFTTADVEEGEVDALVQKLLTKVSKEGYIDHFRGKGHKHFRSNYLEMWDKVGFMPLL